MTKRLMFLIAAVCVLGLATPSQATFWNNDWGNDWNFEWPSHDDLPECDWDWGGDWGDQTWPTRDNRGGDWWNKDNQNWGDWGDWGDEHEWDWKDHKWHCDHKDDPIPEPATAGLAFMGLVALGFAVRRRK